MPYNPPIADPVEAGLQAEYDRHRDRHGTHADFMPAVRRRGLAGDVAAALAARLSHRYLETCRRREAVARSAASHHVSANCRGERCRRCGQPATHKIAEEIPFDDPLPHRHELAAYLCCVHFAEIFGAGACSPADLANQGAKT